MFFPRIDTPGDRGTRSWWSPTARRSPTARTTDTDHQVQLIDARSLIYRQINTAKSGKYRITKTYVTDPDRSAVLVDVRFESLTGSPYERLPAARRRARTERATTTRGRSRPVAAWSPPTAGSSSAVLASSGFTQDLQRLRRTEATAGPT